MGTRFGISRYNQILIGLVLVLTPAYWLIIASRAPVFRMVPGYFWHAMAYIDKQLDGWWVILPVFLIACGVVAVVSKTTGRCARLLPLLIMLGYVIQMGFGLSEGRGIDGIRDRTIKTGHAEFARVAAQDISMSYVATRYEEFLKDSDTLRYVNTKPPGQLLFYMLAQRISNAFSPVTGPAMKFERLATFAAYVFPLLTYLVLIPLFYLARILTDERRAILACLLYVFIPNVTLVTLHLDQVLYPLLAILPLYLAAAACRHRWVTNSLLCGASLFVALFVSFSLLPVVPLAAAVVAVVSLRTQRGNPGWMMTLRVIGGVVAGGLLVYALAAYWLNYNPITRYESTMLYHLAWKQWTPGFGNMALFALLNFIELACWIGMPVTILYSASAASSLRETIRKNRTEMVLMSLALFAVLAVTALFGRTKGEVARIWIFFVPLICLFASHELDRRFKSKANYLLGAVLALQFLTIIFIKKYQDFW